MKIRSELLIIPFVTTLWYSCSNETESPVIDCSQSDLAVAVITATQSDCGSQGSLIVEATGGSGNYLFSVDGSAFQSSTTLSGLTAGSYTITVKDSDGCTQSIVSSVSAVSGSITLDLTITDAGCDSENGSIMASASGGTPPYLYSIDNGAQQVLDSFEDLSSGSYEITIEDANNCEATRTAVIGSGVSLANDIMPIISSSCAVTGCHNGSRVPDLRSSAGVIANAARIKTRTSAGTMPPSDREDLSQEDIEKIACWVDSGAPDN